MVLQQTATRPPAIAHVPNSVFRPLQNILFVEEGIVYETTDYAAFTNLPSNREVHPHSLVRLTSSIELKQLISPILVNERLEVIDGQHRLAACIKLNKPVYFLVRAGLTEEDFAKYNDIKLNWEVDDFVKDYAALGYPAYQTVLYYHKALDLKIQVIVRFLTAKRVIHGRNHKVVDGLRVDFKDLHEGELELAPDQNKQISLLGRFHEIVCALRAVVTSSKQRNKFDNEFFCAAVMVMFEHKEYDHSWMMSRLKMERAAMKQHIQTLLTPPEPKGNQTSKEYIVLNMPARRYLLVLQDIYNFDRRKGDVSFNKVS